MVTGDNAQTALSIGDQCNFFNRNYKFGYLYMNRDKVIYEEY